MAIEKALTIIAVDDEPLALRRVALAISEMDGAELLGTARDGVEGVGLVLELKPDILLLDINMPGLDGFGVLSELGEDAPLVIFVTAFEEHAVRAFEHQAIDYLLKPLEFARLSDAIANARKRLQEKSAADRAAELEEVIRSIRSARKSEATDRYETEIWAPWGGAFERIDVRDIDWIDAEGDYIVIHSSRRSKSYLIRHAISRMIERLDPQSFARVHRSAIVNLNCVEKITKRSNGSLGVLLMTGDEVPVGRAYDTVVRSWIITGKDPNSLTR